MVKGELRLAPNSPLPSLKKCRIAPDRFGIGDGTRPPYGPVRDHSHHGKRRGHRKAHHHFQLGDVFFRQGKLDKAEPCYRAALERDGEDIDTRAHLGQCLLRQNKPLEARPLLEKVVAENPRHDYGHSLMALAETLNALGETDAAIATWRRVTSQHSYPRAKVQLAELLLAQGQKAEANAEIQEVITDDPHAPGFQRKRDRVWVKRAQKLARQVG